jgi:hypothetical protein
MCSMRVTPSGASSTWYSISGGWIRPLHRSQVAPVPRLAHVRKGAWEP